MNNNLKAMNTKVLFNVEPLFFWKNTIFRIMGKAFLMVLVFTFIFTLMNENLDFLSLLKYSSFIMLIPMYKIFFEEKDEIYSIGIMSNNDILIKWNRWFLVNEVCIPKGSISAKVEMHSFRRSDFF